MFSKTVFGFLSLLAISICSLVFNSKGTQSLHSLLSESASNQQSQNEKFLKVIDDQLKAQNKQLQAQNNQAKTSAAEIAQLKKDVQRLQEEKEKLKVQREARRPVLPKVMSKSIGFTREKKERQASHLKPVSSTRTPVHTQAPSAATKPIAKSKSAMRPRQITDNQAGQEPTIHRLTNDKPTDPLSLPALTPKPAGEMVPVLKPLKVSGGVLEAAAINKVQPIYPPLAKATRIFGSVKVQITITEEGRVIDAQAISGNPLFREAAVQAARQWSFTPTTLSGVPVKVNGVLTFNFTLGGN